MIVRLALLVAVAGLVSCIQADVAAARGNSCDGLSPHSAQIACRDRVAAGSRARMLRALDANRRNARALDAEYGADFKDAATDGRSGFLDRLNASQAAWDKYAKAQCDYESGKSFGGSGGWDLLALCADRLNRQRLAELGAMLAADRARDAAPAKR